MHPLLTLPSNLVKYIVQNFLYGNDLGHLDSTIIRVPDRVLFHSYMKEIDCNLMFSEYRHTMASLVYLAKRGICLKTIKMKANVEIDMHVLKNIVHAWMCNDYVLRHTPLYNQNSIDHHPGGQHEMNGGNNGNNMDIQGTGDHTDNTNGTTSYNTLLLLPPPSNRSVSIAELERSIMVKNCGVLTELCIPENEYLTDHVLNQLFTCPVIPTTNESNTDTIRNYQSTRPEEVIFQANYAQLQQGLPITKLDFNKCPKLNSVSIILCIARTCKYLKYIDLSKAVAKESQVDIESVNSYINNEGAIAASTGDGNDDNDGNDGQKDTGNGDGNSHGNGNGNGNGNGDGDGDGDHSSQGSEEDFLPAGSIRDDAIVSLSFGCPLLEVILLREQDEVTDTAITSVARGCPHLKQLDLFYVDRITDVSILEISQRCLFLEKIDLSYTDISDDSIDSIGQCSRHLRSITIAWCDTLSQQSIAQFCTATRTHLQEINLRGLINQIDDGVIAHICNINTTLTSLNVAECDHLTDASLTSFSTTSIPLQHLELPCVSFDQKCIDVFETCPMVTTTLKSLILPNRNYSKNRSLDNL